MSTIIHKPGEGFAFEKATIIPTETSIVQSATPLTVPEVKSYTSYVHVPAKKQIVDNTDLSNHGIVLFRQSDLQDIFIKSGPNAKDNEFQVHYWALTLRMLAEDNSILDIAIPTCFFNYPQQVSTAHIDFEMSDVSDASDELLPLHEHVMQELLNSSLITDLSARLGIKVDLISQHLGSIHRHPGSSHSQSFSGTDYGKNPDAHGIVYPFQTAKLDASFAGIMAIDSGICKLAHNEYRVATGELGVDMTYVKGRCLAIVIDDLTKVSTIESILGKVVASHYIKASNSVVSDNIEQILVAWFKEVLKLFTPNTLAINPDFVTKKPGYAYTPYSYYGKAATVIDGTTKEPESKDLLPFTKGLNELNRMSKKQAQKWLIEITVRLYGSCALDSIKKLRHEDIINLTLERQELLRKRSKAGLTINPIIDDASSIEDSCSAIELAEDNDIVLKYDKDLKPYEDFSVEYKRQALIDHVNPFIISNASDARIEELFEQYIP